MLSTATASKVFSSSSENPSHADLLVRAPALLFYSTRTYCTTGTVAAVRFVSESINQCTSVYMYLIPTLDEYTNTPMRR